MRREDWLERLWETIEARRAFPFRWAGREGSQDCCTFAAACAEAMTGRPVLDDLLLHYRDEQTALKYIATAGGIAAAVSAHLGPPKPLGFMGRGDLCVGKQGDMELVGVCVGDQILVAGKTGLVHLSRTLATVAWGL